MKFPFTDSDGKKYSFDFDIEGPELVEINVCSTKSTLQSITCRPIINGKITWYAGDKSYLSDEAMIYCERLAKLPAFH